MVSITYKDEVIATINQGQTATLVCAYKTMSSDVKVASSESDAASVIYDGRFIAHASAGKTAHLLCEGKTSISDMVVVAEPKPSEGLAFEAISGKACNLVGIGTCTDTKLVIPPASPDGKEVVGIDDAFYRNENITSVLIPPSVENLDGAFYRCFNLASVVFSKNSRLKRVDSYAFHQCYQLASIDLPDTVTFIGVEAFGSCRELVNITIPPNVVEVGFGAFSNCSNITITFTGKPNAISYNAFYGAENATINVPWSEGEVASAPWGAENATINYNYKG